MNIDLVNDVPLTLGEVSQRLPKHPTLRTIDSWRVKGVRGKKLQSVLIGGRRFVMLSALQAFIDDGQDGVGCASTVCPSNPSMSGAALSVAQSSEETAT